MLYADRYFWPILFWMYVLIYVFFLLISVSSSISYKVGVLATHFLIFVGLEGLFLYFWRFILQNTIFWISFISFFQQFKHFPPTLSSLAWFPSSCIVLIFVILKLRCFPLSPSNFFQDFFFIFDFSVVRLKMISLDVGRGRGVLPCSVFSELPGSVTWYLTFIWGKFSVIAILHVSSLFSFCNSHYMCVVPLVVAPQFLDLLFCFFLSFNLLFSFLLSLAAFCWDL